MHKCECSLFLGLFYHIYIQEANLFLKHPHYFMKFTKNVKKHEKLHYCDIFNKKISHIAYTCVTNVCINVKLYSYLVYI